jgi:lauroyl/myristoyl acyltransferase
MPFFARLATTSRGIKKLAEAKQVPPFLEFSVFCEQTKYEFNIFICLYAFHDSW